MSRINVKQLVLAGLMAALCVIGTMLIQVPTLIKGYIHLGDSMVYLCGIILNPILGGLAAAIGSMLADVFSGYAIFAPATFAIKGLDALAVGYVYRLIISGSEPLAKKILAFALAVIAGGSIMVLGYLAYETFLYGFATAVLEVVGNIIQAAGGGILAAPILIALDKMGFLTRTKQ